MRNQYKILSEKYNLIRENEKEDILGGLEYVSRHDKKIKEIMASVDKLRLEYVDMLKKYEPERIALDQESIVARQLYDTDREAYNKAWADICKRRNNSSMEQQQEYTITIKPKYDVMLKNLRLLADNIVDRDYLEYYLHATIHAYPINTSIDNRDRRENHSRESLIAVLTDLLDHGELTQTYWNAQEQLNNDYGIVNGNEVEEELNENEKEDILGGLEYVSQHIEKIEQIVQKALDLRKKVDSNNNALSTSEEKLRFADNIKEFNIWLKGVIKLFPNANQIDKEWADFYLSSLVLGIMNNSKELNYVTDATRLTLRHLFELGSLPPTYQDEIDMLGKEYDSNM